MKILKLLQISSKFNFGIYFFFPKTEKIRLQKLQTPYIYRVVASVPTYSTAFVF